MGLNIQQSLKRNCHDGAPLATNEAATRVECLTSLYLQRGLMPLAVNLHVITNICVINRLKCLTQLITQHDWHQIVPIVVSCHELVYLTHYSYCYCSWNIELCLGFDETPPTVGVSTYISVGTSSIQEIDSNSLIGTYILICTWYLHFYNTYVLSQGHSLQVLELEFILLRILLPNAHSHEVLCSRECVTSLCSCLRRKPSMKIVGHVVDILSIILEEDRR